MTRLLNLTKYWSTTLGGVCFITTLFAAPFGGARGDTGTGGDVIGLTCSGRSPCSSPAHCGGFCLLPWEDCGCSRQPGQASFSCQCAPD